MGYGSNLDHNCDVKSRRIQIWSRPIIVMMTRLGYEFFRENHVKHALDSNFFLNSWFRSCKGDITGICDMQHALQNSRYFLSHVQSTVAVLEFENGG